MTIDVLTPAAGLITLAALIPLAAFFQVSRHADRVRRAVGLPALPLRRCLTPMIALLSVAALLGLAAMQPFLQRTSTRRVRSDAEVLMVLDVSRSMLAQTSPDAPTRLERAKAAAERLRAGLPVVPVGIASLTNRVLPHLFPSADQERLPGDARPGDRNRATSAGHELPHRASNRASRTRPALPPSRALRPNISFRRPPVAGSWSCSRTARARSSPPTECGAKPSRSRYRDRLPSAPGVQGSESSATAPPSPGTPPTRRPVRRWTGSRRRPAVASTTTMILDTPSGRFVKTSATGRPASRRTNVRQPFALAPYLATAAFLPLVLLLWRRDR